MTLFSASAAFRALMNIMEDLYGRKSYAGVWRIAASVAFSVLFLLTIYLALVVLLTGGWLFHLVERLFRLETVTLPWVPAGVPFCPAGVPDGRAPRQAKAAYPYRCLSGRRSPCGRHRPVFLVYRPVFQVLPGLRVPGLGDYPAGVALPVWKHPDSGKCL